MHNESLKPGSSLADGRFIIDKLMAKGGFSYIYEGRLIYHLALDNEFVSIKAEERPVVIKELYISDKSHREPDGITLRWNDENEPDEESRLSYRIKNKTRNEALKLRMLTSPYILRLIGAFEENNTIYQITEKIQGAIDFHKKLSLSSDKVGKKLSVQDALRYITQVSEALKEVHSNNIVHLDIKPENILCDYADNAILMDFGISMTIGENMGKSSILTAASRPWAPPEQYNAKSMITVSFASDIYSLGQTFYAFLTGVIPPDFSEVTSGSAILQLPSEYNKEVSDYLDEVVTKCIQTKRDKRYQTIEEFLFALQGENDYKAIVNKAQDAVQQENYEQAIHLLNDSERYVSLSPDLLNLKLECQQKLKLQQKEGEYRKKESEAINLMAEANFEKALAILELLPNNGQIPQLIEQCKQGIIGKKKAKLIADAESLVVSKQYKQALAKYQKAKVIDQSDQSIDQSIEHLQEILRDIDKNKKYNEFIAIGDKAFENNELEKALEVYRFAKENVTISSFTIDKKIATCVKALSEREERTKDEKDTAEALAKIADTPLLEITQQQQIATEISNNVSKQKLIEAFVAKYQQAEAFQVEYRATQARAKELEQLGLYFQAEEEKNKQAYNVALSKLKNISTPALSKKVEQLKQNIYKEQVKAKVGVLTEQIKKLIEQNKFEEAEKLLLEVKDADKLLFERLQTMLDHQKLMYATMLSENGENSQALRLLQTIGVRSALHSEAQTAITLIAQKQRTEHKTEVLEQTPNADHKQSSGEQTKLSDTSHPVATYGQATQLAPSKQGKPKTPQNEQHATMKEKPKKKSAVGWIIGAVLGFLCVLVCLVTVCLVTLSDSTGQVQENDSISASVDSVAMVEIEAIDSAVSPLPVDTEQETEREAKREEEAKRKAEQAKQEEETKRKAEQAKQEEETKRKAQAAQLVKEANYLFDKGSYEQACSKYVQACKLDAGMAKVGIDKFSALVSQLEFDRDAPAYKTSVAQMNRIKNAGR